MFQSWGFTSGEGKLANGYTLTLSQATKMAKLNSVLRSAPASDSTTLLHFTKQSQWKGHIHTQVTQPRFPHLRCPRWLLLDPTLGRKPRSPFPHACPPTQGRLYHRESSKTIHSEGFETLSPKNENKHQTELWKHQRCF